jgi:hypothetical protein
MSRRSRLAGPVALSLAALLGCGGGGAPRGIRPTAKTVAFASRALAHRRGRTRTVWTERSASWR